MTTLHERKLPPVNPRLTVTRGVCRDCAVMVPAENIETVYHSDTHRTVSIYCEHCDKAETVEQVMADGRWENVGEIATMNRRHRNELLIRLSPQRREIFRRKVHETRRLDRLIGKRIEEDESSPIDQFEEI